MKYHLPSGGYIVPCEDFKRAAYSLRYVMRTIREIAGLPMDRYSRIGPLTAADHAQQGVIDAAKAMGIDMGADWCNEIDLRNDDEIQEGRDDG